MSKRLPAPWKHLSDGHAIDYQVLSVREMQVEDPRNGSVHPRVRIDCPDWVNVIPVTDEGEVVLIRQFRCGIWANTLEIPGGLIDEHEEPLAAAGRELEEETGYRARDIVPLGVCHPNPAIQSNRLWTFLARGCERLHNGHQDVGEDIAVEVYPRQELARLIREGQISHALVLAAFLFEQLQES